MDLILKVLAPLCEYFNLSLLFGFFIFDKLNFNLKTHENAHPMDFVLSS